MQKVAKKTAEVLHHVTSGEEAFEAVFLSKLQPTSAYDQFWRVTLPAPPLQELLQSDIHSWRQDFRVY